MQPDGILRGGAAPPVLGKAVRTASRVCADQDSSMGEELRSGLALVVAKAMRAVATTAETERLRIQLAITVGRILVALPIVAGFVPQRLTRLRGSPQCRCARRGPRAPSLGPWLGRAR